MMEQMSHGLLFIVQPTGGNIAGPLAMSELEKRSVSYVYISEDSRSLIYYKMGLPNHIHYT